MKKNILIATSKIPESEEGFHAICAEIRKACTEESTIVHGILWTNGPGCSNLVISVECSLEDSEKQIERFANWITMALMPSRWCTTADEVPEGDTCLLF